MPVISLAHRTLTDYNLLVPLMALLEEQHITRAAERCGMSQPAMSRALERARLVLRDPLLTRRGTRYERTPRGEQLFADLRDLLPRLDAAIFERRFDAATSRDRFRVVTTDYAATILLPDVVAQLAIRAPHARIDVPHGEHRLLRAYVKDGTNSRSAARRGFGTRIRAALYR